MLQAEHKEISLLWSKVNALQDQVEALTQERQELWDIIRELRPEKSNEEVVDLNIDWRHVRSVVKAAASEFKWNVDVSVDIAENLIIVAVPEDQDDLMVETEFDFYSSIMRQLSQEVFRAINFLFVSDSDNWALDSL